MSEKIDLGTTTERGQTAPAVMDLEELLGTRLLVQGNSGSGKSHLIRRMLEQSANKVQQCIIDPEGDFVSLSEEYGHVVIEANRSEAELQEIGERVRIHRASAVLNLESLDVDQQMRAAAIFLNALFDADREHWYPCLVVVDEAQLFAPSAAGEVSDDARKLSLGAMTNLMCRGRKRGLAGVIATQRLAKLAKNVAAEASNFLMGRTFLDIDMARAADLLGMDKREAERFRDLARGSFIALGPAISRKPMPVQVGTVITKARGSTPKLAPPPEQTAEERSAIILAPTQSLARTAVRRPPPVPTTAIGDLLATVEAPRQEELAASDGPAPDPDAPPVDYEAIYRRVVADIMSTPDTAFWPESKLFSEFETRIRIQRLGRKAPSMDQFRKLLVIGRAGVDPRELGEDYWQTALAIAAQVSIDLQSVYLLFAAAAKDGRRCPPDLTIARVCGSGSTGRAFSRVKALEQSGYLIIREDLKKARIVELPDLSAKTEPGDPKAPDDFIVPIFEDAA